ncbi:hypothetical protein D3C84_572670 [compost metagenome]
MLNARIHVGFGQFDADSLGFRNTKLVSVLDFDQQQMIGKFISTNSTLIGFVTMAQAGQ